MAKSRETGQAGTSDADEIEVTLEMMQAGRAVFDAWMNRWDYLADGLPHESEVDRLTASLIRLGRKR